MVNLLNEADELRKLRDQADHRTAHLIPALFYEMFGDPATNPNYWPKVKVKDAVDLINGRAFKPTEWSKNGLPIIRIQNLKNGEADFNHYEGQFEPKHHVKRGALLIAWAGQLVSFGVHTWAGPEGVLNQHIFKVEPRVAFEIPFLQHMLSYVVENAKSRFQGSEMKHLTRGTLDEAEIFMPRLSLQKEFAWRVTKIRELKADQAASRLHLDALFQSTLHRAFQGEL
jgi:type I restriction enzyme S subunit